MTNSQPLVSIIVPVYNSERYLRHCVDSIIAQTYMNLEILLIDDGATDSSGAICDEYAAADPRVKAIHQPNGGIAVAQNRGLDEANGELIAFCDNDDVMHSQNIEVLLRALNVTGADMAKGRWQQIGVSALNMIAATAADQQLLGKLSVIEDPLNAYQNVFCKSLRLLGGPKAEARYFNEANWCRLYRREIWDNVRFPVGHYAQDIRVAGRLYSRMHSVADVDQVLYYWLQEPDSVTHSKRGAAFWHDNVTSAAENFRFTLDCGVVPSRNFFGLTASVRDEGKGLKSLGQEATEADWQAYHDDLQLVRELTSRLNPTQRLRCRLLAALRSLENMVYDRKIHAMK